MPLPRLSAIAVGLFLGFVLPIVSVMLLVWLVAPGESEKAPLWLPLLNVVVFAVALGAPVFAGYLAARIAQVQPLLHGCIVGVLGSSFIVIITTPAIAGLWSAFIFIPGSIAGAWIWKSAKDKSAP